MSYSVTFWLGIFVLGGLALVASPPSEGTLGVIAAIGPVRQGLRIQPVDALRDE